MKITVKLFGTLRQYVSGNRKFSEIEIDLPEGSTVKDLLAYLGIPVSQGVTTIAEGKVLTLEDAIQDGSLVHVMQAVRGG